MKSCGWRSITAYFRSLPRIWWNARTAFHPKLQTLCDRRTDKIFAEVYGSVLSLRASCGISENGKFRYYLSKARRSSNLFMASQGCEIFRIWIYLSRPLTTRLQNERWWNWDT